MLNQMQAYQRSRCGGTLDVAKSNTSKGLSSVLQFVTNTEHTIVIMIDAPHRFDLESS